MTENSDEIRLKRLRFRSWHRGCKETDLILGRFCDSELASLNVQELDVFEALLEEDDADIWNWLAEKQAPPAQYDTLITRLRQRKQDA